MADESVQVWPLLDLLSSHLSKRPSDLKQNGTQEKTLFSGMLFHTLSNGVIRFVAIVTSENHFLAG